MSEITFYTVDLAKRVFQVHGYPRHGRRVLTRRLSRARFQGFFERDAVPGAPVVMEACGGAHFWGRWLQARGFAPVLLPPRHVRAFVTGNKTDAADADALAVAWRCGQLHPVPIKTETQQAIQLLHRVRERRLAARTAVSNQIRALLREYGIVAPAGATALSRRVAELQQADAPLAPPVQAMLAELVAEWQQLRASVTRLDQQLTGLYQAHEPCRRLGEIPGIGVLTATALVAGVPDIQRFKRGRALAAWLGLTPKELTSGHTRWLGGITKRGNTYLRTLLIHGARSAVRQAHRRHDATGRWLQQLIQRRGHNRAVVALANKNARITWALLAHNVAYQPAS